MMVQKGFLTEQESTYPHWIPASCSSRQSTVLQTHSSGSSGKEDQGVRNDTIKN